jgi:peptidoglycan/xylan/chitin deacetylase (PgdA/CDA1 family)
MISRPWQWSLAFLSAAGLAVSIGFAVSQVASAKAGPNRPIDNDCSAGHVEFTFDDGPGIHSRQMLDELNALRIKATFFAIGENIVEGGSPAAALLRDEVAAGHSVQNHTYDHASITGGSTETAPLSEKQIVQELDGATRAIVAAGLPRPTLYRPPYGDIDTRADDVARGLGYRIVMPWGLPGANVMDSKDWSGVSTEQIASNVINGYTIDGGFYNGIKDGTIVLMHDGLGQETLNSIAALQPIVDYMNAHQLCSTSTIRADATGGVVPPPPLPEPGAAQNLVQNPSLEKRRAGGSSAEPTCFQRAGAELAGNEARWSRVSGGHRGKAAEQVTITRWTRGDRKLVLSQSTSDRACLPVAKVGVRYGTWLWYKGNWPTSGSAATKVCMITYYRDSSGTWQYWQTGSCVAPASTWKLARFVTAPLPAGASAVSFGLALMGKGTLITDDYSLAAQ